MARIEAGAVIDRRVEAVFDFVTDLDTSPEWQPDARCHKKGR